MYGPRLRATRSVATAVAAQRQAHSSLPPFQPPRTLLEAIDAAREQAQAEVQFHLPDNATQATIFAVLDAGSAFRDAESIASRLLAPFLSSERRQTISLLKSRKRRSTCALRRWLGPLP